VLPRFVVDVGPSDVEGDLKIPALPPSSRYAVVVGILAVKLMVL